MPYRDPQRDRMSRATLDHQFAFAGQVMTLRHFVTASAGIPEAGIGETPVYQSRSITALIQSLNRNPNGEKQSLAGMIAAGEFALVTREHLQRADELVWRGVDYRVESDPVPSTLNGQWITHIKRGDP